MKRLQLLDEEGDCFSEPLEHVSIPVANHNHDSLQFDPLPFWQESGLSDLNTQLTRVPSLMPAESQLLSSFLFDEDSNAGAISPRINVSNVPTAHSIEEDEIMSVASSAESHVIPVASSSTSSSRLEPPRIALESEDDENPKTEAQDWIAILQQPPREVRTRKKKEKRSFSVRVKMLKPLAQLRHPILNCRLVFADDYSVVPEEEECFQTISVSEDEKEVLFQDLGVTSPCLKWKDREFCLEISLVDQERTIERIYTRRMYAYSNIGVLQRRREVEVVALSARYGSAEGAMRMHMVGKPFFKSDRLKVVFRVLTGSRWVSLQCHQIEFYSESVLFFTTPKIPSEMFSIVPSAGKGRGRMASSMRFLKAFVQVTNDGVNFSNGLEFMIRLPPVAAGWSSIGSAAGTTSALTSNVGGLSGETHSHGEEDLHQARL